MKMVNRLAQYSGYHRLPILIKPHQLQLTSQHELHIGAIRSCARPANIYVVRHLFDLHTILISHHTPRRRSSVRSQYYPVFEVES